MNDRQRKIEWWTKIVGAIVASLLCAVLVIMSARGTRERAELARQSKGTPIGEAIDPALITYREIRRIETGISGARGIALKPEGGFYVAGEKKLQEYGNDGARQQAIPLTTQSTCVAVAPNGLIVIGFPSQVEKRVANLAVTRWDAFPINAYLTSVSVRGKDVWIADAANQVIYRYDLNGHLIGRLGKKDMKRGVPGLVAPGPYLDVAAAQDGTVWTANPGRHRLEHYAQDGRLLAAWGKAGMGIEGFSGCCNPTDFALLPDGRIVTAEKGLRRVKVYRPDGALDGVVAGPDAFRPGNGALDVAADGQGRIYVLDPGDGIVHVFVKKTRADSEVRAPKGNDE